jgi:hypothetical protein
MFCYLAHIACQQHAAHLLRVAGVSGAQEQLQKCQNSKLCGHATGASQAGLTVLPSEYPKVQSATLCTRPAQYTVLCCCSLSSGLRFLCNICSIALVVVFGQAAFLLLQVFRDETQVTELHGHKVADPYRWLEDPDAQDTQQCKNCALFNEAHGHPTQLEWLLDQQKQQQHLQGSAG